MGESTRKQQETQYAKKGQDLSVGQGKFRQNRTTSHAVETDVLPMRAKCNDETLGLGVTLRQQAFSATAGREREARGVCRPHNPTSSDDLRDKAPQLKTAFMDLPTTRVRSQIMTTKPRRKGADWSDSDSRSCSGHFYCASTESGKSSRLSHRPRPSEGRDGILSVGPVRSGPSDQFQPSSTRCRLVAAALNDQTDLPAGQGTEGG